MQRTRLNTIVEITGDRLELLFSNPWRRVSLSLISILLGFFMGSAIVTTAGQRAVWDIPAAAVLFAFTELTSRIVYGRRDRQSANSSPQRRSLYIDVLNLFKIGLIYSLFLEAFKLGS
ncbi:MAG: DUF565 domain-containing protein [Cyanobacteria bacterium J06621_8]